jgi:DNA polymerase III delta prime subunit
LNESKNSAIPTHLFVGEEQSLISLVKEKLKNYKTNSVLWISPKKSYVLEDLQPIFEKTRFSLAPEEYFFFVLQKTELLTPVCANKLLKTLEEPPRGYIFFLLTNNEDSIIPTIRSRSHIHRTASENKQILFHPILKFFDAPGQNDPFSFEQELKKQDLSEQKSMTLFRELINSTQKQIIEYEKYCAIPREIERLKENKTYSRTKKKLSFLLETSKKPPQPGGAKMFWKRLFLLWESF